MSVTDRHNIHVPTSRVCDVSSVRELWKVNVHLFLSSRTRSSVSQRSRPRASACVRRRNRGNVRAAFLWRAAWLKKKNIRSFPFDVFPLKVSNESESQTRSPFVVKPDRAATSDWKRVKTWNLSCFMCSRHEILKNTPRPRDPADTRRSPDFTWLCKILISVTHFWQFC